MTDIATLGISVDSRDLVSARRDMQGFASEAKRTESTSVRAFKVMAGAMAAIGAAAWANDAIREARKFSAAMAEVSTLIEGTPAQMKEVEQATRSMSKAYGTDATEQVQAYYQALSSGAEVGAEATQLLDAANKLAIGGVTDTTTAIDALSTAINAYGKENITALEASDAMFVAIKRGKTTAAQLGAQLGNVVPIAASLGVSFDELLAATAALTTQGQSTATAVTGLRQVMAGILKPTAEATKFADALGLAFDAQALKAKGLHGFLEDVIDATGGNQAEMAKLFGSVEALNAVLAFAGGAGDAFADTLKDMTDKAGETQVAFGKINAEFDQRLKRVLAQLRDLTITAGNALLQVLVPALELAASVAQLLAENIDILIIAVGTLAAVHLPAAAAAAIAFAASLTRMQVALVAGLAATRALTIGSKALGVAMRAIPFVAVVAGIVSVYRAVKEHKKVFAELQEGMDAYNASQAKLGDTLDRFYSDQSVGAATALKESAEATAGIIKNNLTLAKLERENAGWASAFGVEFWETERMREADKTIRDLANALIDVETQASIADHRLSTMGDNGAKAITQTTRAALGSITAWQQYYRTRSMGEREAALQATKGARAIVDAYGQVSGRNAGLLELTEQYGTQARFMQRQLDTQKQIARIEERRGALAAATAASQLVGDMGLSTDAMQDVNRALAAISVAGDDAMRALMFENAAQSITFAAGGLDKLEGSALSAVLALSQGALAMGDLAGRSDAIVGNARTIQTAFDSAGTSIQEAANKLTVAGFDSSLDGVKAFQKAAEIQVDGIIGPDTLGAIDEYLSKLDEVTATTETIKSVTAQPAPDYKLSGLTEEAEAASAAVKSMVALVDADLARLPATFQSAAAQSVAALGGLQSEFEVAGAQAMAGLEAGILSGIERVAASAKLAANSAATAAREALDIRSPSRVFGEIGGYMMDGLSLGIDERSSAAIAQIEEVSAAAGIAMRAGLFGAGDDAFALQLETRIATLAQSLLTETEVIEVWRAEQEELLTAAREKEFLGATAHKELMLGVERQYFEQIGEIQSAGQQRRLNDTVGLFSALASVTESGGDRLVKITATFEAIQGTINAYAAAVLALKDPSLTWQGRIAAYTSVLAAGLKGVSAIKAAGGSGGGSSSSGSASSASTTSTEAETRNLNVTFDVLSGDTDALGRGLSEYLIDVIQDQTANGLNINTRVLT